MRRLVFKGGREVELMRFPDSAPDPGEYLSFAIVDSWRDRAAVDSHVGAAHVAATIAKLEPLLAEPPVVRVHQRVNP